MYSLLCHIGSDSRGSYLFFATGPRFGDDFFLLHEQGVDWSSRSSSISRLLTVLTQPPYAFLLQMKVLLSFFPLVPTVLMVAECQFSLVWPDPKKSRLKRDLNPGSAALEVDALLLLLLLLSLLLLLTIMMMVMNTDARVVYNRWYRRRWLGVGDGGGGGKGNEAHITTMQNTVQDVNTYYEHWYTHGGAHTLHTGVHTHTHTHTWTGT